MKDHIVDLCVDVLTNNIGNYSPMSTMLASRLDAVNKRVATNFSINPPQSENPPQYAFDALMRHILPPHGRLMVKYFNTVFGSELGKERHVINAIVTKYPYAIQYVDEDDICEDALMIALRNEATHRIVMLFSDKFKIKFANLIIKVVPRSLYIIEPDLLDDRQLVEACKRSFDNIEPVVSIGLTLSNWDWFDIVYESINDSTMLYYYKHIPKDVVSYIKDRYISNWKLEHNDEQNIVDLIGTYSNFGRLLVPSDITKDVLDALVKQDRYNVVELLHTIGALND